MFQEGLKTSSVVHSSRSLLLAKRRMRLVCGNWKVVLRYHTTSRVKSMRNILLVWQPPAAHTLSGRLGASQVKSMQLEATLYSEQFYAQNILLVCWEQLIFLKLFYLHHQIILKRKSFKYIQVRSLYWSLCYDLNFHPWD